MAGGEAPAAENLERAATSATAPARFVVLSPTGQVLYDSAGRRGDGDGWLDRLEVRRALDGQGDSAVRYQPTSQQRLLSVAVPIERDGQVAGVVLGIESLAELDLAISQFETRLIWTGIAAACLAALWIFLVWRRWAQPLEEMRQAAERFARGELGFRLIVPDSDELAGLAEALNQMSQQLQERISTIVRQNNEQRAVLSSMVEGVLAVDNQERVISLNKASGQLLGIDQTQAQGRSSARSRAQRRLAAVCHPCAPLPRTDRRRRGVSRRSRRGADMTCKGQQYEVGQTYKLNSVSMCKAGFHFCENVFDVYNYYPKSVDTIVCEVEASEEIQKEGDKSVTNTLKIVKKLNEKELLEIWINKTNSGYYNSGDRNSGDRNSGNRNSGGYNSGDCNSGHYNSGYCNSGNYNSGNRNSGNYNSGYCNSGHCNSGDYNSGHCNSGDYNSGNYNSGDYNSGHCNSGDYNSGNYNSGDCNSGFFNTDEPTLRLFNKQTKIKRDDPRIQAVLYLGPGLTEWVAFSNMTDEEKKANPKAETTQGFNKTIPYKEAWLTFWVKATEETRKKFLKLPEFNAKLFLEITGIDVKKKY